MWWNTLKKASEKTRNKIIVPYRVAQPRKGNQMNDATESIRRQRVDEINFAPGSRESLEAKYGQVWTTDEMSAEFVPLGFMAPLIVVSRRSDGMKGSLEFQHSPRF